MFRAAKNELAILESGKTQEIDLYAAGAPLRAFQGRAFCCGCPLWLGAYAIMGLHFLLNLALLGLTLASLFTKVEGLATGQVQTTLNLAYALVGLAIIAGGVYGARHGKAAVPWIYFAYLVSAVCYATYCLVDELVVGSYCAGLQVYLTPQGQNAVCGMFSANSVALVAIVLLFELYLLWLVWSFIMGIGERDPLRDQDTLLALMPHGKRTKSYGYKDLVGEVVGQMPGLRVRGVGNCCWCFWCCNDESEGDLYLDPYANVHGTPDGQFMTGYQSTNGGIFRGTFHDTRYPAPEEEK